MIQISHNIKIFSRPEQFFVFYNNYDRNFIKLSPKNHLFFKFHTPPPIKVGTTTLSEEMFLGKYQKVRHRIVEITPEKIVLKGLFPLSLIGGKLIFKIEINDGYIILFEILEFGYMSFMGRLFDPILKLYLKDKYSFLNNHSKETLLNIKSIIENNTTSASIQ